MVSLWRRVAAISVSCSLFVAVCFVAALALRAQDAAQAPAEDKPAAEAPAADAPAADGGEDFDKLFGELKELIVELNDIRTKYAVAEADEQAALEAKYKQLVERGQTLFPKLGPAAEKAFSAKPDINGDAGKHLLETVQQAMGEGDAKEADRVVTLMLAKLPDNSQLLGLSGTLAFNAGDDKKAGEQFDKAAKAGKLPEGADKVLDEIKIREAEAKADDLPRVKLETNQGTIVIELFENEAPNTVANFISLVEKKFYDGLVFHRVIDGFMAQGGDPTGTGSGGPGYAIPCECYAKNHRNHFRGTLSMAHAGKDTGGSQFFLCFAQTTHLDGKHTAFGRVIEGMDVLDKIKRIQPGEPGTPDKIVKATVVRKREHEYKPKTLPDPRN